MNIYKQLILLATAASCLACNKEIEVSTQNSSVKTLTIEAYNAENQTKNLVDEFGSVLWNPNDSISVFFGDYCVPFYSYNSKPVARANFIGTALVTTGDNAEYDGSSDEYEYWGVYPYQTHQFKYVPSKYEGGVACFVDESQTAVENTFNRSTFVTVARSSNYSKLAFYNLCGGVRFKLASSDIEMVTFSGNNNEPLAGEVVVDMDTEGHPYVKNQYSEIKTIRLTAPEGGTFKAGVWYYFVSLPADLSSGFTMKFISKSENKMAVLETDSPVRVERSHFGSLDFPDAGLEYTQYDNSEERTQLRNEVYVKSVTMGADESFSLELGYPTIATQKIFEKIKFKIFGELISSWGRIGIGKLSETLYCVGIRYDYDEYSLYLLSPEEQYQIQYIMNYTFPNYVFYSSKSKKFISIDTSDDALHRMAHINYNYYLGSSGNNNFFCVATNYPDGYDKTNWQKFFNIIETENNILLQEWGDIDTDIDIDTYSLEYFWLAENKFPALLYEAESGKVIMETFPEKGVMHKLVLSDQPDYFRGNGLIKAGKTTYWKYEKGGREYSMTCFRQLATENGAPVEGNLIIAPYTDLVYYNLSEPKMSILNHAYYSDYRFGGYYERYVYLKLFEDGSLTSYTIPQDYYIDNDKYCNLNAFEHSGYMARLYLTGKNMLTLKDFDYVTDKMTTTDNAIPEHIGSIRVKSGVYDGNLVFVTNMVQASDTTNISFVIDCRSKETFIKKGDIQLEGIGPAGPGTK